MLVLNDTQSNCTSDEEIIFCNTNSRFNSNFTDESDYIFNRIEVKCILIVSYTIVFCCCFFGNLLVMVVVVRHRRMRTLTNFFLANLAFADFCVGIFCIYQNLSLYLMKNWNLGDFMCKMYHFINSLSYTASVVILVLISVERFAAIYHPIWNKSMITHKRLKGLILSVWTCSGIYSLPRFSMFGTVDVPTVDNSTMPICVMKQFLYDVKAYDTAQFVLCFILPLLVISILYFRISLLLWRSNFSEIYKVPLCNSNKCIGRSRCSRKTIQSIPMNTLSTGKTARRPKSKENNTTEANTIKDITNDKESYNGRMSNENSVKSAPPFLINSSSSSTDLVHMKNPNVLPCHGHHKYFSNVYHQRIIESRRKVIKLLITVVLTFAFCNAPHHIRKLFLHWSSWINPSSDTIIVLTPVTQLSVYLNSALNPFIYAFLSENFRRCMSETLFCRRRFRVQRLLPHANFL